MQNIREFINEHEIASFWLTILLILFVLFPIVGWRHMLNNLLSFYNGENAGEKFISAWITFFIILLVELIKDGNWKIEGNAAKALLGFLLAYYMYHDTKDDMMLNASYDNWFTSSSLAFKHMCDWLGNQFPAWFYADGWMHWWYITRNIIRYLFYLSLMYVGPSLVLAIPFRIIYYLWHKPKDMPSNVYELVGVLVLFPVFFYMSLWITYNCSLYEHWLSQSVYLFFACIVIYLMAGYRRRCPECGGSSLVKLAQYQETDKAIHTGSTTTWTEWSDGLKSNFRTTNHYQQTSHRHYHYKCNRCGHSWWETYTSTRKYDR